MHCREFRDNHVAFVDDLLPAVAMDAMQRHLATCSRCSRQDIAVRRSLMLVRSLPPIEASPDFMARLNERLQQLGPTSRTDTVASRSYRSYGPSAGAFAALAAGMVAVAYMAVETSNYFAPAAPSAVPAVATLPPDQSVASMVDAAYVASVPTAMPVWPAVLMAGQAPMRFASLDFGDGERTR